MYEREFIMYETVNPATPGLALPNILYKNYDPKTGDALFIMKNLNDFYDVGDQINNCSIPAAKLILTEIAKLHGTWWEHDRIQPGGDLHEKLATFYFFEPEFRVTYLTPCFSVFYVNFFLNYRV